MSSKFLYSVLKLYHQELRWYSVCRNPFEHVQKKRDFLWENRNGKKCRDSFSYKPSIKFFIPNNFSVFFSQQKPHPNNFHTSMRRNTERIVFSKAKYGITPNLWGNFYRTDVEKFQSRTIFERFFCISLTGECYSLSKLEFQVVL